MSAAYCLLAPSHPWHRPYHDREYGFPATDEAVLFERLVLEINQAGLSWLTVLQKRAAFRAAFAGFAVDSVAAFGPTGGLIVGEFLMSLGYLPGAHQPDCPVYPRILSLTPPWSRRPMRATDDGRVVSGAKLTVERNLG